MFGLFKPKRAPEGPVCIELDVEIAKPADEVYPLIDWADDRNAKRATGHMVAPLGTDGRSWRMVMETMPDLAFDYEVTEEQPGRVYAFTCSIQPKVGRLVSSSERYTLEPLGEDRCLLTLLTEAEFDAGLRQSEWLCEVQMMTAATQSALQKFRIQAEAGAAAAKALDNHTVI